MVYYTWKGNSKTWWNWQSRVRYLYFKEKHKGSTGGLQRHNEREPGQRHSNKNIKPDRTKNNIFLKPKRWWPNVRIWRRVDDDRWRLWIQKELNDSERHWSRWWKLNRYNLRRYHQGKRRNANQALKKRRLRGVKKCMAKRISFRSDPRRRDNAHLRVILLPCRWPSGRSIGEEKGVIGDKKRKRRNIHRT